MAEAAVSAPVDESKGPGLLARLVGVIFSPRATYAAVVARPRVLGALLVTIVIMAVAEGLFFWTPTGQEVLLDQQVKMPRQRLPRIDALRHRRVQEVVLDEGIDDHRGLRRPPAIDRRLADAGLARDRFDRDLLQRLLLEQTQRRVQDRDA